MKIYLVGGAVRDRRLGLDVGERDWVVVGATSREMISAGFEPLDEVFPVYENPASREQYALARRETKSGHGHRGFEIDARPDVTLEEDLRRRDLTINAMAETESGHLVDPFEGAADIDERRLRHVSPAFIEDPLRVLRAARFSAKLAPLGFGIAPESAALLNAMGRSNEIASLSRDRIWRETLKALGTEAPARYFEHLCAWGALPILIAGPDAPLAISSDDAIGFEPGLSAIGTATARSSDPTLRLVAFLIGLGLAKPDADGSQSPAQIARRLGAPRSTLELVRLVAAIGNALGSAAPTDGAIMLAILESSDAFRRRERFLRALDALDLVAPLDAAGHPHTDTGALRSAYEAARPIGAASIVDRGLRGWEIGAELRRRRIEAIDGTRR